MRKAITKLNLVLLCYTTEKGNAVKRWRLPELSPCDLLRSLHYDIRDVDRAEFVHAEWMWNRKPKSSLGDDLPILVFIGLVLLLIPMPELCSHSFGVSQCSSYSPKMRSVSSVGDTSTNRA